MTVARRLLALGLLAVAGVVAAQVPDARVQALVDYRHDLLSVLALRGDADHLLGAALLARSLDEDAEQARFRRLLERAAKANPDDVAVQWARLVVCDAGAGNCPNAEALARLEQLAPNDAAVWLLALGRAAHASDRDAQLAALTKAAAASRYDDYGGALLAAMIGAATALPVPAATLKAYIGTGPGTAGAASVQAFLAYGDAASLVTPSFLPLMPLCDPAIDAAARANADACRRLAHTLAWGSSPRARAAGLHLREVLAGSDAEREAARTGLRNLTWQVHHNSRLTLQAFRQQALAVELLRLGETGGSRMSRMAALLHKHGIPLAAPDAEADGGSPDWVPDAPATLPSARTASSPANPASPATTAPADTIFAASAEPAPAASATSAAPAASGSIAVPAAPASSAPAARASGSD